jgi:hypothetical protein
MGLHKKKKVSALWVSLTTQPTELENEVGQDLVRNPYMPETVNSERMFVMQHVISFRVFVSIT